MLAQWMEAFFGKKRTYRIKDLEIAEELGWNPKYLSAVLNGHRNPKDAKEKLEAALDRIIARKTETAPRDQGAVNDREHLTKIANANFSEDEVPFTLSYQ